jgi:hypothetical protein
MGEKWVGEKWRQMISNFLSFVLRRIQLDVLSALLVFLIFPSGPPLCFDLWAVAISHLPSFLFAFSSIFC